MSEEEENEMDEVELSADILQILGDSIRQGKKYYYDSDQKMFITPETKTLIEPDSTKIFKTKKEEDSFSKFLKSTDNGLKTYYGIELEPYDLELELYSIGKGKNTLISPIETLKPTEIVDEKTDTIILSLTNKKLVEENIKLTRKFVELNENYEKLVEETNFRISELEKRITALINSKISVSSVPDYWFEEYITEQKEENSDPLL